MGGELEKYDDMGELCGHAPLYIIEWMQSRWMTQKYGGPSA